MADLERRALQLVTLDMKEKKVEVKEDALQIIEKNLKALKASKIAIVSVMGAFRGGKSFLLDLFLRKLRYERKAAEGGAWDAGSRPKVAERGSGEEYVLPEWITAAGKTIEGSTDTASDEASKGFRFKGGMDHCTEGIWVWSEPFLRKINGEDVALLLMDTQGAWDGNMTKEQSATVFGLTALISSKQIYNVSQQIQEDKVENLAYFMRFAQAALRQSEKATTGGDQKKIDTPFQSLDFLVRDWANFEDEWTLEQCKEQMAKHLDKHLNPNQVVENTTAEALQSMFTRISCFCLPHPGLKITKATWSGSIDDIDRDFLRFLDEYVHEVFSEGLKVKTILGTDLTPTTFPLVFRDFVKAFQDAAPVAMSFNQAMTKATALLAKERALESYSEKMDKEVQAFPQGLESDKFKQIHRSISHLVEDEYKRITILGSDQTRSETWDSISKSLDSLFKRYNEENSRRLEKALVVFGNYALLATILFLLDRASDWTCDWWSQTCQAASRAMLAGYTCLAIFVGYHVYVLYQERGRLATVTATAELWKEMIRLSSIYWEMIAQMRWSEMREMLGRSLHQVRNRAPNEASNVKETKKDK